MDNDASGLQQFVANKPSIECPVEHLSSTIQSLDTVRALHQTVVCLRSALEDAQREINQLKKQISVNVDIKNGKKLRRSVDNLNEVNPKIFPKPKNLPQFTKLPITVLPSDVTDSKLEIGSETSPDRKISKNIKNQGSYTFSVCPDDIRVTTSQPPQDRRKPMASKIDVKIKVSSNIQLKEEALASPSSEDEASTSQDNNSGIELFFFCKILYLIFTIKNIQIYYNG